jgi:hypothetical protein
MGLEVEEDLKRKMIELNLTAARSFQSPQTHYIHLNYESHERHDTIPLLENFCFALALIRSRLAENVLEGKTLLEKLLIFEVEGNFPIYLHEFPQCKDRAFGLELLPIFHFLLGSFRATLGEPLATQIEMLIGRILSHAYKMHAQRPLSLSAEFRLKSYFEPHCLPLWTPQTPEEWADALITYQMTKSKNASLCHLLENSLQKWHPQLCVFIGPQFQERGEPKVTLFDLLMGHYHGVYSRRALECRRMHLLASLIQPFEEQTKEPLLMDPLCHAIAPSSLPPFALYWGSPLQLNSLTIEAQKSLCSIDKQDHVIEIAVTLPNQTLQEGTEAIELACFFNLHSEHQILINEGKATAFQLGQKIELCSGSHRFRLEISLENGEGTFFGHILRANRSTQKGKNLKFETFDWQIALRTIRRTENCSLKLRLYPIIPNAANRFTF